MGLSRERVRQIEAQAIKRLQHAYERGKITREELEALVPEWRRGSE